MANFDPAVPDINPPDWTRVSRAIPQPESITVGDKSKGILFNTGAEALTGAVTVGKEIQDKIISDKVRTGVEKGRDAYIDALKGFRNQQIAGNVEDQSPDASLVMQEPAPVPGGLQRGVARIQAIGAAIDQNGGIKANDTLYTGYLYSLAKELRSQYPGSKDFIDAQIAKVSGKDPANAFYENLLQDINQARQGAKSERDKDLALIDKYLDTIPGMDTLRNEYLAGRKNGQDIRSYIADKSKLKISQDAAEKARVGLQSQGALTKDRATKDFVDEGAAVVSDAWQTSRFFTNTKTPKEIADFFTGQATGQTPILSEDENRQWVTNLGMQEVAAKQQLRAIALRTPKDESGNVIGDSYAKSVGGIHNLKGEIDELTQVYRDVKDAALNKDYKLVYAILNENTAMANKATNIMYKDDTIGEASLKMKAVTEAVGPQTGAILLQEAIVGGLDQKYAEWLRGARKEILGQPDPNKPTTFGEAIENAKSKKIADPGVYKAVIDTVKYIADPAVKDKGKVNAAIAAFSPAGENYLSLSKFPSREDQQKVFMTMTDPSITDAVAKLPQGVQGMYRSWVERNFGAVVFRSDINELARIKDTKYLAGYHIGWNTETSEFSVMNRDNTPLNARQQSYARPVTEVLDRLNTGLKNVANVEKSAKGDTNAYVVKVLTNSGFDFKNNVQGIPTKMMDALLNAGRKPELPKIESDVKPPTSQ